MSSLKFKSHVRRDALIPAVLVLLAVALRLVPGPRIIDDAYITYRYARNIIRGAGFVYNTGEYVLGTTTPLYTVVLAALGSITGSEALPRVSVILNALADGANVILLYLMARRLLDHWLAGMVLGTLWAVAPKSVTYAIGGMETSVYIAWMLGAFLAWLEGRTYLSAGLTALAILTRPDALIWAGPLGLAMIVDHWRRQLDEAPLHRLPWTEGLISLVVLLPWLIYGTLRFGSPLTRSIAAKAVAYQIPPLQALVTFLQHYATPFFEFETFGPTGAAVGSIVYLMLSLVGAMFLIRRDWRAIPLVVFPWLYFAVFAWANPLVFRWYLAPPMPMYFLCILAGLWGPAHQMMGKRGKWIVAAAGAGWVALSLAAWTLHPDHGPDRPAPEMAWFELELLYQEATHRLRPLVGDDTVIAAADIGAVGWYSDATILDTLGLVSPESTGYYPIPASMLATTAYAVSPDLIVDQQPDFIIILETYGRNGLLKDARFREAYRIREIIEANIYDSEGMLIFERTDH